MKRKVLAYVATFMLTIVGLVAILAMEDRQYGIKPMQFFVGFMSFALVYIIADRYIWDKNK